MNAQDQSTGNGSEYKISEQMKACGWSWQPDGAGNLTVLDETGRPAYLYTADARWVDLANRRLKSHTVLADITTRLAHIALARMTAMATAVHTPGMTAAAPAPQPAYHAPQPEYQPPVRQQQQPPYYGNGNDRRSRHPKRYRFEGRVPKGVCYKCGGSGNVPEQHPRFGHMCFACLGTGRFMKKSEWNQLAPQYGIRPRGGNRQQNRQYHRPQFNRDVDYPAAPAYQGWGGHNRGF